MSAHASEAWPEPTHRTVHRLGTGGSVRDWLVSEVVEEPALDLDRFVSPDGSPWESTDGRAARWVLTNGPDIAPLKRSILGGRRPEPPAGELRAGAQVDDRRPELGRWQRHHLLEDALLDVSVFRYTPTYRHVLAATVLEVDQPEWRTLHLDSTGPAALWVNGELLALHEEISYMAPGTTSVPVLLPSGTSDIVVASWQIALREVRQVIRLRVEGLPVAVVVPEDGADEYVSQVAEQLLSQVGSTSWALTGQGEGTAHLSGVPGAQLLVRADRGPWQEVRLGDDGLASLELQRGDGSTEEASASMLATGETRLAVRAAHPAAPVERWMRVGRLPTDSRTTPEGSPLQWREEVLQHVRSAHGHSARALASCALDPQPRVETADLEVGLHRIETRGDCADFEILGLLLLWHRVPEERWEEGLRDRTRRALVTMKYWIDQPGLDAMCYFTENHQLVWHCAQRLAGLTFSGETFTNDGRPGSDHAQEGRQRAIGWMRRKLDGGFSEFDSNAYLAIDALSLVTLIELDPDPQVASMAEALLDMMLMTLCCNSWRGVHAAAHGRSYVPTLRSARPEETSPILRLLAGVGSLNAAVLPVAALATSSAYTLPSVLRALAAPPTQPWWGSQTYRGHLAFERDLLRRPYGSTLTVWRTEHVSLSSVQDYRSELPGLQEHVAGAALGPEMQVFITMPANDDTGASARPNAWAGQLVLPRARQDRDVVLTVYGDQAGTGTTPAPHLWLPEAQADEVVRQGDWIAARRGQAVVAVACEGGVQTVTTGEAAWQEHRPRGAGLAWITVVGEQVGSLSEWVESLGQPEWAGGVRWRHPDGRTVQLSRHGMFLVDGKAVDLDGDGVIAAPARLDNPAVRLDFGQPELVCRWADQQLVVDLAGARRGAATDVEPLPPLPGLVRAGRLAQEEGHDGR